MPSVELILSEGISALLSKLSVYAAKPLCVFFDEVDCLSEGTLVSFLRQLRQGRISCVEQNAFPSSVALIGMRDIRDYKARIRPDSETLGSASPFNVITEAMTLRSFTDEEVAALYAQHTAETGQVFEPEAVRHACVSSGGQPYLVNALARWCVEKIHKEDFSQPITFADMDEAKEKLIRERVTTLNSIQKRLRVDWMKRALSLIGRPISANAEDQNAVGLAFSHGVVVEKDGVLAFSCPIVRELVARHGYTAVA